jgi:Mg2+ and Co2+ transporter CorA
MTATNQAVLKRLKSRLNDIGQDRVYLNDRLIRAYTQINELTEEAEITEVVHLNYLQLITKLINILQNDGVITASLLITLLSEHGILTDDT